MGTRIDAACFKTVQAECHLVRIGILVGAQRLRRRMILEIEQTQGYVRQIIELDMAK